MKEGFWLNARSGVYRPVSDHAYCIVERDYAREVGLSDARWRKIADMDPAQQRVPILLQAMQGGMIRVRGHGQSITFEFTMRVKRARAAIGRFLHDSDCAGPATVLDLRRLAPDDGRLMERETSSS